MRPFSVLIAIIFGSTAAISFGLLATLLVLYILQGKYPEFSGELAPLAVSSAIFVSLLCASGASLYATLKSLRWKRQALGSMCLILMGALAFYWPES